MYRILWTFHSDPDELLHQQVAAQSVVEMLQREKSNLTSQLASLNEESAAKDEHTVSYLQLKPILTFYNVR